MLSADQSRVFCRVSDHLHHQHRHEMVSVQSLTLCACFSAVLEEWASLSLSKPLGLKHMQFGARKVPKVLYVLLQNPLGSLHSMPVV